MAKNSKRSNEMPSQKAIFLKNVSMKMIFLSLKNGIITFDKSQSRK